MAADDPEQSFFQAYRRLRAALLGDGEYSTGIARGEEARALVARELRKMRESFELALKARDDVSSAVLARLASLEQEIDALVVSENAKKKKRPRREAA